VGGPDPHVARRCINPNPAHIGADFAAVRGRGPRTGLGVLLAALAVLALAPPALAQVSFRGEDELRGKGGDDTLKGGDGNDVHRGGGGDDDCRGGGGSDSKHSC